MAVHVPPRIYRRVPFKTAVRLQFDRFRGFIEEYSANLSLGGMFIGTNSPLPVGTELPIEFRLGKDYELIRGVGRVVWVREEDLDAENPAGMGIRFLDLTPGSRELIFKMVERRVRDGGVPFDLDAAAEVLPGRPPDPGPAPEGTVPAARDAAPEGEGFRRDMEAAAAAEYARVTQSEASARPRPAAALAVAGPAAAASPDVEPAAASPTAVPPTASAAVLGPTEPSQQEPAEPEPLAAVLVAPSLADPLPDAPTAAASSPAEAAPAESAGGESVGALPGEVESAAVEDEPPQAALWQPEEDLPSAATPSQPEPEPEPERFDVPEAPPPWEQSDESEWTASGERPESGAAFSSYDDEPPSPSWRRVAWMAIPGVLVLALAAYLVQDRFLADEPLDLGPTADWTASLKKDETVPLPSPAQAGSTENGARTAAEGEGGTPSTPDASTAAEPTTAAAGRGSAAPGVPGADPARHIEDITWSTHPGGATFLVWTDGSLAPDRWVDFRIGGANPRHVIRILGIERPYGGGTVEVGGPLVRQVRTGLHSDRLPSELHLVFDLAGQDVDVRSIRVVGSRLRIEVEAARGAEGGG